MTDTSIPEHSKGWKICKIIGKDGIYMLASNHDKNILRIRHELMETCEGKLVEGSLIDHADHKYVPMPFLRADWAMIPPEIKYPPKSLPLLGLLGWWWNNR